MKVGTFICIGVVIAGLGLAARHAYYVVEPGSRGVLVTLGRAADEAKAEGFGFKLPLVSHLIPISVRHMTSSLPVECYTSDPMQVTVTLRVRYHIPDNLVVKDYREFGGDPFDSQVAPHLQEKLVELAAQQGADKFVTLEAHTDLKKALGQEAEKLAGSMLVVEDVALESVVFGKDYKTALEAQRVLQQDIDNVKLAVDKAQHEADLATIKADGESKAIRMRADALRGTPGMTQLEEIVKKWDGKSPLIIESPNGPHHASNFLLSLGMPSTGAPAK